MSSAANRPIGQDRITGWVLGAERLVSVALLVLVLGLTFIQVIARFVFGAPFFWTEELARFSYVWLTFLAATAAMAERSHISVQLLENRLPAWARLALNVVAMAAVVLSCVALLLGSWPWLAKNTAGHSAALQVPNEVFYGVVWVAFAAMAAHALVNIISLVRAYRHNIDGDIQRGGSAL